MLTCFDHYWFFKPLFFYHVYNDGITCFEDGLSNGTLRFVDVAVPSLSRRIAQRFIS
jgi:hypothetical protein